MESLRDRWRAGDTTLGLWASAPSTVTAEALGRTGADYVCIDAQHGLVDYPAAVSMIPAIVLGGSIPLARVPWFEPGIIGKMLDAGVSGVIVPMVNTRAEAEAAVAACHYPPLGARSYGPGGVLPRNPDYFATSADQVTVIVMVETVEALGNVDEIVSVPGVDAVYVGPSDLSISLGLGPGNHDESPEFVSALETIVAACERHGVVPGMHSTGALTGRRMEMGFRMITVTSDLLAMRIGITAEFERARSADSGPADSSGAMY